MGSSFSDASIPRDPGWLFCGFQKCLSDHVIWLSGVLKLKEGGTQVCKGKTHTPALLLGEAFENTEYFSNFSQLAAGTAVQGHWEGHIILPHAEPRTAVPEGLDQPLHDVWRTDTVVMGSTWENLAYTSCTTQQRTNT